MSNYLVVGGNSGIGLAIGSELISQGHHVVQWSRQPGALTDQGAEFKPFSLDQEFPEPPDSLEGVVYTPGSIRLKPFHRLTEDDFLQDYQINALGAVKVLQHALPALKRGQSPSVVLFSSVAATTGLPFHASISMAKSAIEGLTVALAAEWAPRIRVNAIAPSLTDTPLASDFLNSDAKRAAVTAKHPLKAVGDPAAIAQLALYLLGQHSGFVSGQIWAVDGGLGSLRV